SPLGPQPEPPNIVALTAALVERWPVTNLIDVLKETELRVHFTEAFRTMGTREVLHPELIQRRLLLCSPTARDHSHRSRWIEDSRGCSQAGRRASLQYHALACALARNVKLADVNVLPIAALR